MRASPEVRFGRLPRRISMLSRRKYADDGVSRSGQ